MSAAGTENQKPGNSDSRIPLRFKLNLGEGEDHVLLSIKRDTKLQKAIDHLCNDRSLDGKTLRFLYNGDQFAKNKTPEQLGMKKGDEIDVMMECGGGGGGSRTIES